MLTRILHPSEKLCTFIDQLDVLWSKPQRLHILRMADALLVCEDARTLANLQRQFLEAPDASNIWPIVCASVPDGPMGPGGRRGPTRCGG